MVFVNAHPHCNLFICGDLNRFDVSSIISQLDVVNVVTEPTRADAFLDYVLISQNTKNSYDLKVCAPIGSCDHNSILCTPSCC